MRSRTPLSAAAVLLLAIAGCAPGADSPAAGEALVGDEEQAEALLAEDEEVEPEDLGGEAGDIVLTFWHGLGGDNEVYIAEELAGRYSEQTEGVVVHAINRGSYEETLDATILAAGTAAAPHVVQLYEIGTRMARDTGVFVPIHEVDTEGLLQVDDYIEAVAEYYTDETGGFFSAPWNSSSPILYYDATRFEEAGLDPDNPPETYSEVIEACDVLLAETELDACYGMPIHAWFIEQSIAQQGELLADNGNGRDGRATEVRLDSEAATTVLEWWQLMDAEGYWLNNGEREDWDDPRTLMADGQVAMAVDSTAAVARYDQMLADDGRELRTGFMPIPDGVERNGVVIGGASLYIVDGHSDEEIQAALEFVNWMSEPEQDVDWHQFTGYYPIRTDTREQLAADGWFDEAPNFLTAVEQLEATEVNAATRGALLGPFPQIRSIILDAVEDALFSGADAGDALGNVKPTADSVLQEYNELVEG
jgi:sn-glycerol 3-phosphate transport system substrate-binding protein